MRVVAVGAHPDDIEYGCGGTLLKHVARGDRVTFVVLTDGAAGGEPLTRSHEATAASGSLGAELIHLSLSDGSLAVAHSLIARLEAIFARCHADVVYTHLRGDLHQDHVATATATAIAARHVPSLLQFESPRSPALAEGAYVDVSDVITEKLALIAHHTSQCKRDPLLAERHVLARAHFHGARFGVDAAEAFLPVRIQLQSFAT